MKTPLLSTLTLAAALAVAGVSFAKAEEAAVKKTPQIDSTTTASIMPATVGNVRLTCDPAADAACTPDGKRASNYPVNALEGMNLGW
jgi:hypothetical protein